MHVISAQCKLNFDCVNRHPNYKRTIVHVFFNYIFELQIVEKRASYIDDEYCRYGQTILTTTDFK